MKKAATLLAAAITCLALASCGGGEEAAPAMTEAEIREMVESRIAELPTGPTEAEIIALIERQVAAIILTATATPTPAPPKSNQPEYTKHVVNQAIALHQQEGQAAAVAHANDPANIDGQWYVYIIGPDNHVLAHPDAERLGLDVNDWVGTDANGYNFGPDLLAATEEGKWVSYVYTNPESGVLGADATGESELKHVWARSHDGLVFASGWYVSADEFTKELVATGARVFREGGLEGTLAYFNNPDTEFAGLHAAIAYYNASDTVEGRWFAFTVDPEGTFINHFEPQYVGTGARDFFGFDLEATPLGDWVETESLRVWVLEQDGYLFGSGWRTEEQR